MIMENMQGQLKMDFPFYSCFPAITKLIAGLHTLNACKSRANVAIVLKDRHFDVYYL